MNVLGKIRRLRFREGLSIIEISRRLGVARNTVKRWLNAARGTEPKYRRKDSATLITAYEGELQSWLETDARRPKRINELLCSNLQGCRRSSRVTHRTLTSNPIRR